MRMHTDTRKEHVTIKCTKTDQTPISTQDNHHDAQKNKTKKIKVQDKHMKLYEIISRNRFTNLPLFSVPFLSGINYI